MQLITFPCINIQSSHRKLELSGNFKMVKEATVLNIYDFIIYNIKKKIILL